MTTPYQLTSLLYGPGDDVPGSDMTDEEALTYARKNFAHLESCLVRDWIWDFAPSCAVLSLKGNSTLASTTSSLKP